ncbi:AAA family ATPase [Leptolyngbya sp. AN02str]|uniref:AAA family ATPase n=1 Tax=Leptolyngbya sp. AN02str TaxID=3423363 RepID=UPI003D3156A4
MVTSRRFPQELLNQSKRARLRFFKKFEKAILHRNLKICYQNAKRVIYEPAGASVIMVIGPSGVGKTTLLNLIKRKIKEGVFLEQAEENDRIPFVDVEAVAPGATTFRWKDFYKRTLLIVDKLLGGYIDYDIEGIRRNQGNLLIASRVSESELREALEKAISELKPHALAMDEMQHIGKMTNSQTLESHMDCVKSIVNLTKVPWVGFGTYQLLDFLKLSPQLSRRRQIIHFQRYKTNKQDLEEFRRILKNLQFKFPLLEVPDLSAEHWEFCYERSIGCVGTLIDWLTQAFALALEEEANTITATHLEKTAKSVAECAQMLENAMEGETKLQDSLEERDQLRSLLGLSLIQKGNVQTDDSITSQPDEESKSLPPRRPGTRNPERDPVGELA